ncbi:MAG: hypothetical protein AB8B81_09745 [Halioglobus sp.]
MGEFVLTIGLLLVVTFGYMFVQPQALLGLADRVLATRWVFLAALVRLMIGAALIASAPAVKFPEVVIGIGWLLALSGLILVAVPPTIWCRFSEWLPSWPTLLLRALTLIGLGLGAFLLFASLT